MPYPKTTIRGLTLSLMSVSCVLCVVKKINPESFYPADRSAGYLRAEPDNQASLHR